MKQTLLLMLTLWTAIQTGWAQNNSTTIAYIAQYKTIAMKEMKRTGVPASITLAQAIVESNSGESNLAKKEDVMYIQNYFTTKKENLLEFMTQIITQNRNFKPIKKDNMDDLGLFNKEFDDLILTLEKRLNVKLNINQKHDLKKQVELHEKIRNDEDYDDWEYGTEPSYGSSNNWI